MASVIIVGAGPAGVRAGVRLVAAGVRPIVIDEARVSGGQIYRRQPEGFRRPAADLYGLEAPKAEALHRDFDALKDKIDYRPDTLAWNIYEGQLHVVHNDRSQALSYDALILATGATDRLLPVPGWTLPGVYSLGGSQIALKAQACAIGSRPVFMGTGPLLYLVAYQYAKAGVRPVAVLDTSTFSRRISALPKLLSRPSMLGKGLYYNASLAAQRIPMLGGITPIQIEGTDHVTAVSFQDDSGKLQRLECDAVGTGYGLRSETQLADLAHCDFAYDPAARQYLPVRDEDGRSSAKGVYIAGDGAKILGADAAELAGQLAACAVLTDLGKGSVAQAEVSQLRGTLKRMERFRQGLEQAFAFPVRLAAGLPDDALVCRCEAITAGELRRAATDLGAPEVNRAKAFSRVGMGRCQGRYCGLAGAEILAAKLGVPVEQVGRLRGQAPVKPLPLTTEAVVEPETVS